MKRPINRKKCDSPAGEGASGVVVVVDNQVVVILVVVVVVVEEGGGVVLLTKPKQLCFYELKRQNLFFANLLCFYFTVI